MIVYFSGTGNSRAVARLLGKLLMDDVTFISPVPDLSDRERVIWVTPIYAWGIPPIVVKAIKVAKCLDNSRHFLVATHGDDLGNAHKQWRQLINDKKLDDVATFSVTMPNTYVSLPFFDVDPDALRDAKLAAMPARVEEIAAKISRGLRVDDVIRGSMPDFKTSVIYPPFIKKACSSRAFSVDTAACVSCGRCEKICPVNNISLPDGHPQWADNCAGCLACYHVCPVHAINRRSFTRHKGRYICPIS